jgi:predicted acylesterase/phospholipase RssA
MAVMPQPPPAQAPPAQAPPKKKPRRRALLFAGGGVDTVMQLGVAHALLVNGGAPPDYIVGVSAGAVNAAAVAEILQAGPSGLTAKEQKGLSARDRLPFQVARLRNFIGAYAELPRTLFDALLPDSLEILAREPLQPLELPIHFDDERAAREVANEAKAGLVGVFNDLLGIRVSIGTATRIARKILGWTASAEVPNAWKRLWSRVLNEAGLLRIIWFGIKETAPLVANLFTAYVVGPNRAVLRGFQTAATADKLMSRLRILDEVARPVRFSARTLLILHLYVFVSVIWLASVVVRVFGAFASMILDLGGWLGSVVTRMAGIPAAAMGARRRFASIRDALAPIGKWFVAGFKPPLTRMLSYYGLADGLANTDVLKQLFVSCFDQEYYGRTELTDVLSRSLDYNNRAARTTDLYRKRLSDYQEHYPKIHVAPVAADVRSGTLRVLPREVPVVDALLAATAKVPLFPAVKIDEEYERERAAAAAAQRRRDLIERGIVENRWRSEKSESEEARAAGRPKAPCVVEEKHELAPEVAHDGDAGEWFIDAANVSNEALGPLIDYVRQQLVKHKDTSTSVDIYRVSSLPIGGDRLECDDEFEGVLKVVPRALQLKRFRDATIEQQMTALYTRVLQSALPEGGSYWTHPQTGQAFVNATVFPLEPQQPVQIQKRVFERQKFNYHDLLYQTIADGCRASMEGMLPSLIMKTANKAERIACASVIQARCGSGRVPGNNPDFGPGLAEVCRHCALSRNGDGQQPDREKRAMLRAKERERTPDWPLHRRALVPVIPPHPKSQPIDMDLGDWPRPLDGVEGTQRPLTSLLFGGGVFRGVFHMGVMNALNEVGLYPDVVAGSSVGSIVAAMIAQVFSNPISRQREIAHLAATFLSIDRLVLTDRFADFVRRLTLRAAETKFSLNDLDLLFRRYDSESASSFNRRMRIVSAGVERLSYISPFELTELTRDLRLDQIAAFLKELGEDVQEFLNHYGIGQEILGAEPLALLIQNHVLSGRRANDRRNDDLFRSFRDCGIYFLATATNLASGALEILGESKLASGQEPSLLYGLLGDLPPHDKHARLHRRRRDGQSPARCGGAIPRPRLPRAAAPHQPAPHHRERGQRSPPDLHRVARDRSDSVRPRGGRRAGQRLHQAMEPRQDAEVQPQSRRLCGDPERPP